MLEDACWMNAITCGGGTTYCFRNIEQVLIENIDKSFVDKVLYLKISLLFQECCCKGVCWSYIITRLRTLVQRSWNFLKNTAGNDFSTQLLRSPDSWSVLTWLWVLPLINISYKEKWKVTSSDEQSKTKIRPRW